jgi:hypothetical protein
MNKPKIYQGVVAEEDGQLVLIFDPKMCEDLGWNPDDTIVWDIRPDGVVVMKKQD